MIWKAVIGESPLIAAAIHNGHDVRPEVGQLFALSEEDRLREEDPYTAAWTAIAETQIVGLRSRFEVDLNRPRNKAVYRKPEDAWGLKVWTEKLPEDLAERSLGEYDAFYKEARRIFSEVAQRYGRFVVYDLHTYNHRRDGPKHEPASPNENPEVNIGTGTMNHDLWAPVVERFMTDLKTFDFGDRKLDVRENIKFKVVNSPVGYMRTSLEADVPSPLSSRSSSWTNGLEISTRKSTGGFWMHSAAPRQGFSKNWTA